MVIILPLPPPHLKGIFDPQNIFYHIKYLISDFLIKFGYCALILINITNIMNQLITVYECIWRAHSVAILLIACIAIDLNLFAYTSNFTNTNQLDFMHSFHNLLISLPELNGFLLFPFSNSVQPVYLFGQYIGFQSDFFLIVKHYKVIYICISPLKFSVRH